MRLMRQKAIFEVNDFKEPKGYRVLEGCDVLRMRGVFGPR